MHRSSSFVFSRRCVRSAVALWRLHGRMLVLVAVLVATGLLLFPSHPAWGQAFVNGAITGSVTDSTGAAVPGATMTLTNLGTNVKTDQHSDQTGFYQFVNLPPGNYRLDAEKTGFSRFTRGPLVVLTNANVRVNVALEVGALTQTVEVKAETPLLQGETSSLGQVIETRSVTELPLNGRNPLALVELAPGVVPQGSSGGSPVTLNPFAVGNIQISGGAANQSAGYWDGAPLNSVQYINLWTLLPQQEALQEFKVQTDAMSAEYDRFAGGIVSFTTKSGTNNVHGSVYEFLRNKVLNANNFFNNRSGLAVPSFTQNQFGGTIGGPVYLPGVYNGKNKTFFFASYDGFRLRQGNALLFSIPTAAMHQGDFSGLVDSTGAQIPIYDPTTTCGAGSNPACATDANGKPIYVRQQIAYNGTLNVIPPGRLDATSKILANLWALPNLTSGTLRNGLINNWAGNAVQGGGVNEVTIRGDQNVSDKQRIFGRYTINKWQNSEVDPFHTHAYPIWTGVPETFKTQQMVIDDSYSFSPTKVLDVSLSYLRNYYLRTPVTIGSDLSKYGPAWAKLQNQVDYATLPNITVSGITSFSFGEDGSRIIDASDDWVLAPNLTMIKGRHTWKFGADLRMDRFSYYQVNDTIPGFTFDNGFTQQGPTTAVGGFAFAGFMLGTPASGNVGRKAATTAQQLYRAWYIMDDIHATNKLTINLGFRYSGEGPNSERYDRISVFLPNVVNPLIANTTKPGNGFLALVNTPQYPSRTALGLDKHMFGPRLGFAYRVTGDTVIRSAYGIFWLPISAWGGVTPANDPINGFNTPMQTTLDGGLTPYNYVANPYPAGIVAPPMRNSIYNAETIGLGLGSQIGYEQPGAYTQQWNFGIQRTWKGGIFMDIAYAGSKGTHLQQSHQLDQLPNQYESMGSALVTQVPNPYVGIVKLGSFTGPTISAGQLLRPYPAYNGVSSFDWRGMSNYHSLQLKLQKRFSNGQTFLLAYTNSKFITDNEPVTTWLDAAGGAGFQNNYNLNAERSLSSFDVPQRLVLSYVLDLPIGHGKKFLGGATGPVNKVVSGWGLQGITTFQRGFPVFIGDASNTTTSFGGGQRPDYNPNGSGCASNAGLSGSREGRLNRWFNTNCFSHPASYTFGNLGRVLPNVRWDGINNFDFALIKNTGLTSDDRIRLQFRGEFFDGFNHPQFGNPGNSRGTGSFGVVSSQVNNPRLVQFGLKLLF